MSKKAKVLTPTRKAIVPIKNVVIVRKEVVELECPEPDCRKRWLSSHGELCPHCVAHGYKNKGTPVKKVEKA